jgi:hypothetical protein
MRVRTAVGVVSGFVVVKAAITWAVLNLWASYPERPGGRHWHIELGPLAEWLAAVAATGAAITALYIAGRDRQQRVAERHDHEKAQARLVQVELSLLMHSPDVIVQVRNFGSLPTLDVDLTDAAWVEHLDARWVTNWMRNAPSEYVLARVGLRRRILMPGTESHDLAYDRLAQFGVCFLHPTEDRPLRPIVTTGPKANYMLPLYVEPDLSKVAVQIRFTAANGVRWEIVATGVDSGEPIRIRS